MERLQADRPDGLTLEVSDTPLADQEALERRRLLGAEPPGWEALVASGLLPW